ncbi:Sideroflexin [Hondaea fermentalgiana]|uniref:Sideroflexin n=1 Tax=Hondaea fermentalgiana TaxID=2315210 RepID=A0A2R5GLB1_9STRA|nr:Sideroflexin [Hondaea fermentalgiana]|eukprot:GBG29413.1 Sideroflexin [Hondaea fermentalgiana]
MAESSAYPTFNPKGSRFDESTYFGRIRSFLDVVDPRLLAVSDNELNQAKGLLQDFDAGKVDRSKVSDKDLWEAKKIRDGLTNPGTGETIFAPFRFSAFVPANISLVYGMLNAHSVGSVLFWQWANQSYNSATNYANRSGSDMSTEEIATSYSIAIATSCGLAMAFRWLGNNGPQAFKRMARIPFVIPYIAVAGAGAANVYATRRSEIENGVMVKDANDNDLGVSQEAGRQGVMKTIISRSLGLPIPVLVIPALIMHFVPKTLPKRVLVAAELLVISSSLCVGLPATLAIFPQKMALDAQSLEPAFHNLRDENGERITTVYSNKGL